MLEAEATSKANSVDVTTATVTALRVRGGNIARTDDGTVGRVLKRAKGTAKEKKKGGGRGGLL